MGVLHNIKYCNKIYISLIILFKLEIRNEKFYFYDLKFDKLSQKIYANKIKVVKSFFSI
jgi:hypothetical protein